jgi:hypothetical protein
MQKDLMMLKRFKKRFYEAVNNSSNSSKDPIIGFIDESSLYLSPNKVRVNINTKHVRYSESNNSNRSKTIFGFMAINGNDDVAMVSDRAKANNMLMFLELIRKKRESL